MIDAGVVAGFTHVDDKGRVTLSKSVRGALGIGAGSSLAWIKLGDAILLVPQDAQLERIMDAAAQALERAHVTVREMLDDLPEARAEVVTEHYGEDFMRTLERMREERMHEEHMIAERTGSPRLGEP